VAGTLGKLGNCCIVVLTVAKLVLVVVVIVVEKDIVRLYECHFVCHNRHLPVEEDTLPHTAAAEEDTVDTRHIVADTLHIVVVVHTVVVVDNNTHRTAVVAVVDMGVVDHLGPTEVEGTRSLKRDFDNFCVVALRNPKTVLIHCNSHYF
jgi:hypothetical protein